jgi:hypothetical protein
LKDEKRRAILRGIEGADMTDILTDLWRQEKLKISPAGQAAKTVGSGFYRGETCQFNPYHADHAADRFAERFLLEGWTPPTRFITPGSRITTFGSCFAQNVMHHLRAIGFDTSRDRDGGIYISLMSEGLVNVHALLQQFEWALEGQTPPENLWHGFDAESFGYDEAIRVRTREIMLSTNVFILTFGLSEIWYDQQTGGVFWRAVPMKHYDSERHRFRVASFAETKGAIQRILALIANHAPDAAVVMTLSPVPLAATFRPVSCLTANSASKALIRAALDEVLREAGERPHGGVYYFPAYEAVKELFPQPHVDDGRHFHSFVVPSIMALFEAHYCQTDLTPAQAELRLRRARIDSARSLAQHPLFGESR